MQLAQPIAHSHAHLAAAKAATRLPSLLDMMDGSGVLMALFDAQDHLQHANDAFLQAYHVRLEDRPTWVHLLRDNYVHQRGVVINSFDFDGWLASARSRRGQQAFRGFETDLWDGRWLWMTETLQPNGWMLCIATDITHLKASEHALRHARDQAMLVANTDALTGIGNRRHVLAQLHERLDALHSPVDLLSVVVADLDQFKRINDRFGHPAGDLILQDFAVRSQRMLKAPCTVGRVGGEEFMLVLPGHCSVQAEQLVEQLHAQVRLARPVPARPDCRYTFSAGIAHARIGESLETVFRRADLALYQAKQAGRDRTVIAAATPARNG